MKTLDEFLAECEHRCKMATPPPWNHIPAVDDETERDENSGQDWIQIGKFDLWDIAPGNAAFISHARTALPLAVKLLRIYRNANIAGLSERLIDEHISNALNAGESGPRGSGDPAVSSQE